VSLWWSWTGAVAAVRDVWGLEKEGVGLLMREIIMAGINLMPVVCVTMFGLSLVAAEMGCVFNSYVWSYGDWGKYVECTELCWLIYSKNLFEFWHNWSLPSTSHCIKLPASKIQTSQKFGQFWQDCCFSHDRLEKYRNPTFIFCTYYDSL
jgi:hypothetical protein